MQISTHAKHIHTILYTNTLYPVTHCCLRERRLVRIDTPICRIPMLAIHLARKSGTEFTINKENHLSALLASKVREQLEAKESDSDVAGNHHPALLMLLADNMGCKPEDICDFDLQVRHGEISSTHSFVA